MMQQQPSPSLRNAGLNSNHSFFITDMDTHLLADQIRINNEIINGTLDPQLNTLGDVVSRVTTFLIPIGAVILLFVLIWGGYDFMLSQGNPEKVKTARAKITAGIIGLVIMVFAFTITRLIAMIFNLESGLSN